jgi:ABC-type branched-subunit amino acid transport system substrate-binding protein
MCDHASELGPVAFDFDEGPAKLGLFGTLRKRLLEQTAEPVLLALDPEDVLNFLQSARARNVSGQKQTTYDLSTAETGRVLEGFEVGEMLIADPYSDEMAKTPHRKSIGSVRLLSSADLVWRVRISRRR